MTTTDLQKLIDTMNAAEKIGAPPTSGAFANIHGARMAARVRSARRNGLIEKVDGVWKEKPFVPAEPKPKLDAAKVYLGDNGRAFCGALRCAGSSAHFTGRTIAGQRVMLIRKQDVEGGEDICCEGCGLSAAKSWGL
jgi:hypothetical protein